MNRLDELRQGICGSYILPFLWMKGEDNKTLAEELDKIEECGIREICLESRPYPDYCGPQWWKVMDFLLPELKRRGMKIWILDDKKFPTGYANGGFERRPELKKVYLAERHMDIMGPCRNSAVLVEPFLGSDGKLIAILACPKPDTETLDVSGEGILNLTDGYKNGFVFFDLPEGAYRLFILFTTQKGGGRDHYMNLIDRESVKVLIDEVYEKHYEHCSEYFGNVIAGFFSDEPELGNINGYPFDAGLGRRDVRLPWSHELENLLREEWKDGFAESLPALWYGMGEQTGRVRSQYMEALTDLVYECFSSQVGNWCQDHGVEYIGHIIEDDNAHTRLASSIGHYFREMKGQHMAGIDVVHHQIVPGFTGRVHQWIAGDGDGEFFHFGLAKLGSSAAHIDPKKKNRALCEIFGNYGWAEGVTFMKWLTNHMLVRGINIFTPHAFSMTYPDRDCPPHFYARGNNPQFKAFAQLMKYMQRACHLLSGGQPLMDAAVLYHAEAEWSAGKTQLFQKPMRKLMEAQIDCDVIPADILQWNESVQNGKLIVGNMSYKCLVLPYAECLKREVAEFVIRASAKGLKVYVIDALPEKDTMMEPLPFCFADAVCVIALEELAEKVRADIPTQIMCSEPQPGLRFMAQEQDDCMVYMFFNENLTKRIQTTVQLNAITDNKKRKMHWYDPWTEAVETECIEGNCLPLSLEPGEAAFCVQMKAEDEGCATEKWSCAEQTVLDLDWKVSRADELHYGEFEVFAELSAGCELPNMNGPMFNPGFTGFYRYDGRFTAEKKEGCRYWLMIPDGGDTAQLFVNGKDLGYIAGFPGRAEVTEALKNGENEIRIEWSTTLVWKRKDGASTHLQVYGTGLLAAPVLMRCTK